MLAVGVGAFLLAALANPGTTVLEVECTVVLRGNHELPVAIREAVFSIPDDANQAIVEVVGPVVNLRDTPHQDAALAIDVHPTRLWREYGRESVGVKVQLFQDIRRDRDVAGGIFANAVRHFATLKVENTGGEAFRGWPSRSLPSL